MLRHVLPLRIGAGNRIRAPCVGQPTRICHENSFSVDVGSCGLGLWFEGDAVAETLDTSFEVGDGSGLGDLVKLGFSEFAVGQALGKHVIGSHEDLVSDSESRAHGRGACLEAVELVLR